MNEVFALGKSYYCCKCITNTIRPMYNSNKIDDDLTVCDCLNRKNRLAEIDNNIIAISINAFKITMELIICLVFYGKWITLKYKSSKCKKSVTMSHKITKNIF